MSVETEQYKPDLYRHECVADLAWIVKSPSLLVSPGSMMPPVCSDDEVIALDKKLLELDKNPQPLLRYLQARSSSHFLGPYFENLWGFYLEWHPRFEVVARNLQIFENGKTIGEFDVLLYDRLQKIHIHQELAVKFYLGQVVSTPVGEKVTLWLGPNRNDHLDRKYSDTCDRQIRLSEQLAAQAVLEQKGVSSLKHQLVFKGYLFQPVNNPLLLPDYVNPACEQGFWVSYRDFTDSLIKARHDVASSDYWMVLEKSQWFSRKLLSNVEIETGLMMHAELIGHLNQLPQSRCLMIVKMQKQVSSFAEQQRFMLVPSGWEEGRV